MSEWFKVPVLKTGIPEKVSGVRILLHPLVTYIEPKWWIKGYLKKGKTLVQRIKNSLSLKSIKSIPGLQS